MTTAVDHCSVCGQQIGPDTAFVKFEIINPGHESSAIGACSLGCVLTAAHVIVDEVAADIDDLDYDLDPADLGDVTQPTHKINNERNPS